MDSNKTVVWNAGLGIGVSKHTTDWLVLREDTYQ